MAEFTNINKCYSFNLQVTEANLQALPSFPCSEVLIYNKSNAEIRIHDVDVSISERDFVLGAGQSIVMRGLTDTSSLSVISVASTGPGRIYCRSAYFSNLNQR